MIAHGAYRGDVDAGAVRDVRGDGDSVPTRNCAISPIGFWVADKPMRTSGRPARLSSRASESARWLPRLFDASAWISSTMTVRVVASIVRPDSEPSSTYSDSGVVT